MNDYRGHVGSRVCVTLNRGASVIGTLFSITTKTAWILVDHEDGMMDEFIPMSTVTDIDPSS